MNHLKIIQFVGYGIKILTRDWGFRFISLFCAILITFLHFTTQKSVETSQWIAISLPSAIPFANAYIVNYLQVLIVIFWGGSFIYKEQKIDSNASLDIRPFSNKEYLWGETIGFIVVLLGLDFLLGVIAIIFHLLLSDSPFTLYPYIFYFLTLTLPTLVFTTGLTVAIKGLVRNRGIAFLVLIGIFALDILYTSKFFHGATDLFASSLPNAFSDITGFAETGLFLLHRLSFLLMGSGLIFLSISTIRRIPNNLQSPKKETVFGLIIILLGITSNGIYLHHFNREEQTRQLFRNTFVKYEETPKVHITNHHIRFKQQGRTYSAVSQLEIINPNGQPLSYIILYLNPGLKITDLQIGGKNVDYTRENQVAIIKEILQPQETKALAIHYEGSISPEVCYIEIEDLNEQSATRKYSIFNMGENYFYLEPEFTVLTPECLWYPTSLPTVNTSSPYTTIQNYTRFELSVIGEKKRMPVSQGIPSILEDTIRFSNTYDLPSLSLCIGNYTRKAITVEDKTYEIYVFKGHEYLIEQFPDPQEIIKTWNENYIFYPDRKYVFHKIALIETPVHFCAYTRMWKKGSEYLQPELIFRPEREALTSKAFKVKQQAVNKEFSPQREYFYQYKDNYNEKRFHLAENIFNKNPKKKLIKNEYDFSTLERNVYFYIYSPEFPGIDLFFQEILSAWEHLYDSFNDYYTYRKASFYLNGHSLREALKTSQEISDIISAKSEDFAKRLLCFIPYKEFRAFTENFFQQHAFQTIRYEEFCSAFEEQFGFDLLDFTRQCYDTRKLPAFLVKDAQIEKVEKKNGETGYIQSVKIWNRSNADGVITIVSPYGKNMNYLVPAGSCQEIREYFEIEPSEFELQVETNLAQNRPSCYSFPNIRPSNTIREARAGIYDADTNLFLPKAGEYIVDDNDPGFHIITDKRPLKNNLLWEMKDMEGYGEIIREFHVKLAGQGNSPVEWEVQLPEEGEYELFIYNNKKAVNQIALPSIFIQGKEEEKKNPIQTYQFTHADGEEKVELKLRELDNGWISIGKYRFNSGTAKIRLEDKGVDPRQKLLADAVKWVKIDEKQRN